MTSRVGKEFVALEVLTAASLNLMPDGWVGYGANSANQTGINTSTDITNANVTIQAGTNRLYLILATVTVTAGAASQGWAGTIVEDSTVIGRWARTENLNNGAIQQFTGWTLATPSAGTHTYKLAVTWSSGTGSIDISGTAPAQAKIVVIDLGPTS